jgi:hypothetical protein
MVENEYRGEVQINVRIAETHCRQRYLLRLCKALMKYGAPTHRLEEYMCMTARVLDVDGQFLYIPGCMVVSFDDATTHATDVKLVKAVQGVDLGRLFEVHKIYKEVVNDVIDVGEATERLETIMKQKPLFNVWVLILMHGFASASVGPLRLGPVLSTCQSPLFWAVFWEPCNWCYPHDLIYIQMFSRYPRLSSHHFLHEPSEAFRTMVDDFFAFQL